MEISLIPDSAPFNIEQRAWLNGFLAGWLGLQDSGAGMPGAAAIMTAPALSAPAPELEPEPWHDPALPINDRLQLADGQPIQHRLMAAMAQLDCGACGYVCKTYSEAIAKGDEPKLNLCAPGGSETSKVLKKLLKEHAPHGDGASANGNGHAVTNGHAATSGVARTNGWSRENPYRAELIRNQNLNRPGSEKETYHVEIGLGTEGPAYKVGDSLGLFPENCPELADDLVAALGATGDEPVTTPDGASSTLRAALVDACCLTEVTEEFLAALAGAAHDSAVAESIRGLIDDDAPIKGFDVLDVLRLVPAARLAPEAFVASLSPLKPRLYSISSSPRRHAGQVHLTVRKVAYEHNARTRKGVASSMLADRVAAGSPLKVFIQKSHGFTIPADPNTPMIMIGPGTGIAPFRAFLHERDALGASGKNWLVFGDQRGAYDFLYEDELTDFLRRGVLTRLDTAFSRDQDEKLYVQHRLIERGATLYDWLEEGAHVYICGDARRMAADVDKALQRVIREHGGKDEDGAKAYLTALASSGRYCRDVY